jgi:hypothetical protein
MGAFPKIFRIFFSNTARDPYGTGRPPGKPGPPPEVSQRKACFFAQSEERKRPETMRSPCLLLHVSQLDVRRMKPKASNVEAMRARAIQTVAAH